MTPVHYLDASGVSNLTFLLVLFPVLSATVLLLGGRRTNAWGHLLGCAAPLGSFVVGVILFADLWSKGSHERQIDPHLFSWVPAGTFRVHVNLLLDPLPTVCALLITGVGALIPIYSIG